MTQKGALQEMGSENDKLPNIKLNIMLNVIRQTFNVLLPLLMTPYITRVLTIESYGNISFSRTCINYFTLIACLGIGEYSVREASRKKNNKDAFEACVSEIYTINFGAMIVSYCCMLLILLIPEMESYRSNIMILMPTVFFTVMAQEWVCTTKEEYLFLTVRTVIMRISTLALVYWLIKGKDDAVAYVIIISATQCIEWTINFVHVRKTVQVHLKIDEGIRKHIKPIVIIFGYTILQTIYTSMDTLMLGFMKGDEAVGIYAIGVNVYAVLKSVINAFTMVIIARLSKYLGEENREAYARLVTRSMNGLIMIIFPIMTGMFCVAPEVIILLGGEKYLPGIISLRILCVAIIFATISYFLFAEVLLPNKKEHDILVISFVSAVANFMLNLWFIRGYSYNGAAVSTALAECLAMMMALVLSRKSVKLNLKARDMISVIGGAIAIVVICALVGKIFVFNIFLQLIFKIIASVILYISILVLMKNSYAVEMIQGFMKFAHMKWRE